jgi:uncharacterized protein YidB (DUF937 family)
MGILDSLLKNPGSLVDMAKLAMENPDLTKAAMSMLSPNDSSVGGSAGLGEVLESLKGAGLGDMVSSWLGSGENKPVDGSQIRAALDDETLNQFAGKAGLSDTGSAAGVLAGLLPQLVDQLSPDGKLPESGGLDKMIGGLLGRLT